MSQLPTSSASPLMNGKQENPTDRFEFCFLSQLATIEVQLIMHGLEARELLQLMRCSKQLYHAADSDFAWKYAIMQVSRREFFQRTHLSSVIKRISLSVDWAELVSPNAKAFFLQQLQHAMGFAVAPPQAIIVQEKMEPMAAFLSIFASGARIHELNATDRFDLTMTSIQWTEVLSHPQLQQLRVLRIPIDIDDDRMKLIAALPHLHSLTLTYPHNDGQAISLISTLPHLTQLHIIDGGSSPNRIPAMQFIAQCIHLTQLSVYLPSLYETQVNVFFSSPHMQRLKSITFEWLVIDDSTIIEDWNAAFRSLRCLHSLTLACVEGIDRLLPCIALTPILQQLTLIPCFQNSISAPSMEVLESTLTASSQMKITIRLNPLNNIWASGIEGQRIGKAMGETYKAEANKRMQSNQQWKRFNIEEAN